MGARTQDCKQLPKLLHHLLLTQLKDVSDSQYNSFRRNVPYLILLLVFHPLLRRVYETLRPIPNKSANNGKGQASSSAFVSVADADQRLEQRASFDYGFALIFIVALHGFSAAKVMLILYINFCIATRLPRKYVPAATWIYNVGTLFANELAQGYHFGPIAAMLGAASTGSNGERIGNWGTWMDGHGGIMPRWEVLFNITVLRLVSFNLDYYWSLDRRASSPTEVCQ